MKKYYKGSYGDNVRRDLWDDYESGELGYQEDVSRDDFADKMQEPAECEQTSLKRNGDSYGTLYPIEEPIYHPVTGELLTYTEDRDEIKRIFEMRKSNDPAERELGELLVFVQIRNVIWSVMQNSYSSFFTAKGRADSKEHRNDLFMQGYEGVLLKLDDYDPDKSLPNTYFYPHIQHQMGEYINKYIKQSSAYTNARR